MIWCLTCCNPKSVTGPEHDMVTVAPSHGGFLELCWLGDSFWWPYIYLIASLFIVIRAYRGVTHEQTKRNIKTVGERCEEEFRNRNSIFIRTSFFNHEHVYFRMWVPNTLSRTVSGCQNIKFASYIHCVSPENISVVNIHIHPIILNSFFYSKNLQFSLNFFSKYCISRQEPSSCQCLTTVYWIRRWQ